MDKSQLLNKLEELASKTRWARHLCAREEMDFREFLEYVEAPEEGPGYLAKRGVKLHNYWLHEHLDEMLEEINALKEEAEWVEISEMMSDSSEMT
ncbi:MAG: hypothetical protein DWQ07_06635 [Chloroflexi bacterium]|nr:MAG: hypothetical protein DWQ07_06635 [Chloroflexota bacterium]MBL1195893.1 hypothetical protein [Chloroflexota bacterium]NOH13186.1 hypothetical protein [Chloroflexota bacterium]